MHDEPGVRYAVITGDVVQSSGLPEAVRRDLPSYLRSAYEDLRAMAPSLVSDASLSHPMAVYRGDGFQIVVSEPAYALHTAVALRVLLLAATDAGKIELRMAIGIGGIDFIPESNVQEGDGEAFQASGRALDEMKGEAALAVRFPDDARQPLLQAVASLINVVSSEWTANQARAVAGALRGLKHETIAKSWPEKPITRQNVGKHLRRAHWDVVSEVLECARVGLQ